MIWEAYFKKLHIAYFCAVFLSNSCHDEIGGGSDRSPVSTKASA